MKAKSMYSLCSLGDQCKQHSKGRIVICSASIQHLSNVAPEAHRIEWPQVFRTAMDRTVHMHNALHANVLICQ